MNDNFALCREMKETADVIRRFDPASVEDFINEIDGSSRILLTGEGSSRIFPAKRSIAENSRRPAPKSIFTEGSSQAAEYDLSDCAVIGASNSGRTKELVSLFRNLKSSSPQIPLLGVTAHNGTPLTEIADRSYILSCGAEAAVAATKSVVEQALFYQALFEALRGNRLDGLNDFADEFEKVLTAPVDPEWIAGLAGASRIYFAGRNDGAAEELALKINEITRKPSAFLEGTYVLHGIEEVMKADEVLILVEPFESEYDMYLKNLEQGVGMTVLAVSDRETPFPTFKIPESETYSEYLQLAAGWNLMVETGLAAGIDLDKPERARKIGNSVA